MQSLFYYQGDGGLSGLSRCHKAPEGTGKFDFSTIPTYHGSPR